MEKLHHFTFDTSSNAFQGKYYSLGLVQPELGVQSHSSLILGLPACRIASRPACILQLVRGKPQMRFMMWWNNGRQLWPASKTIELAGNGRGLLYNTPLTDLLDPDSSQPLKPLAKGLYSIFNWVICSEHTVRCDQLPATELIAGYWDIASHDTAITRAHSWLLGHYSYDTTTLASAETYCSADLMGYGVSSQ